MSNKSTVLLEHHLKELKLPTFLKEYDKVASRCAAEGVDHPDYLLRLSELELIDRNHRMVDRRIKAARFPTTKSLDTFDFLAIPSLTHPAAILTPSIGVLRWIRDKGLDRTGLAGYLVATAYNLVRMAKLLELAKEAPEAQAA